MHGSEKMNPRDSFPFTLYAVLECPMGTRPLKQDSVVIFCYPYVCIVPVSIPDVLELCYEKETFYGIASVTKRKR